MITSLEKKHEIKKQASFHESLMAKEQDTWKRKLNMEKKKLIMARKKIKIFTLRRNTTKKTKAKEKKRKISIKIK